MKTFRLLSLAAGLALALAGCTGPAGPDGAPGPAGAQGNANVVSQLFTVTGFASNASPAFWYAQLTPVSALTSGFISAGGVVSTFVSYNNGSTWNAVPYSEVVSSGTANWTVNISAGLVEVNYAYSNGALNSDPLTEYSVSSIEFNVVCIATSVMKKHPGTDWHNYYQVQSVVSAENGKKINQ